MPRPLKVFLCHAHSDKDTVKAIYARLKREGVDVWLDKEKLLPGADWEFEIRKAVRESDVVIVCLSKHFNQAGFRQKEVRIALEEADKKPEGEIFIIPARLEECDNLESLSRWHWVDLFESDGFQRLILALRIRADKIGAALRQRGVTLSRQKKNTEQQDAEKEHIESARREDEEQERQRLAKEQADREAIEKAQRETAERETAEKLKREQAEREANEKAAREKAESEKIELAQAKLEVGRVSSPTNTTNENASRDASPTPIPVVEKKRESASTPAPKLNVRTLGKSGIVFACLLLAIFGRNYLINNINPTAIEPPIVFTPSATKTKTPVPTKTFTPSPPSFTTATPDIGSTMRGEDGMLLMFVPEGEFTMGSDTGSRDEQPIHTVNLDAFWIDQTEVTNAMYAKCVADGGCTPPSSTNSYTHDSYYDNSKFDDFPVMSVDWNQAYAYCLWAGRRLPTEAEWEKAARGTDERTYPWGNTIDGTKLNYCGSNCSFSWADKSVDDGYADVSPVGNYSSGQSIYGALNMAGNIWEWVNDWYDENYYATSPSSNPEGPTSGQYKYRVLRGGSWSDYEYVARSALRNWNVPSYTSYSLGFRCALSQP